MTVTVILLQSAETDLRELKSYLVENSGQAAWQQSYTKIKDTIARVAAPPRMGGIPNELTTLNLVQYRQVLSGMNRIIYELRGGTAFVHIICDTRKDLQTLLMSRILKAS
jgi:plasmid stabilization system protein ParE